MFVRNSRVYYSASDLKAAVECEWALMRKLDAKLGRIEAIEEADDPMLARASLLGGEHEARALENYKTTYADGVVEIETEDARADPDILRGAQQRTIEALKAGKDVVFQATFFDEPDDSRIGFVGFADFLIRSDDGYQVWDTKLARKARVTALLQLAAYGDQLRKLGIPVSNDTFLLLGNGKDSAHKLSDIEPVFHDRVARLKQMIEVRLDDPNPIEWGAPGYAADGRCEWCAPEVERTRDVLLVAGMRITQRARLAEVGIHTIDDLAASEGEIEGIGPRALTTLREQARMQLQAPPHAEGERHDVLYRVHDPMGLAALPAPDAGDIFFDFEGDPLWSDDQREWGLDYLFGVIEHGPGGGAGTAPSTEFRPFWAHNRVQERQALIDFLDYVQQRRKRHPGLHIYHYADYERSHLQLLCARYGTGEAILDELLREHVFVDLYPIVKRSIRISENSYSLKKLEPLYMGDELRESSVTTGADSVTAYVDYTLLRDAGRADEADAQLAEIADYNRYDCLSTLRLRDWLLARADESGVARRPELPADTPADVDLENRENEVRSRLYASIDGIPAAERDADQTALALAAAAIEYHRREDKTYWWEHFNRQIAPLDDWADTRDVFITESAQVVTDWSMPTGKRTESRVIRLRGRLSPGSRLGPGDRPHVMYDEPLPPVIKGVPAGQRGEHEKGQGILELTVDGDRAEILLDENAGVGGDTWTQSPVALTPPSPIPTKAQREAILQWGGGVADALPAFGGTAALDLLRRIPPRMLDAAQPGGGGLEPVGVDGTSAAIVESLLRLDDSYLAVQGPPGSGKTYVGAKVIAHLVQEEGWRIGVVAQSHEVVENVLRRLATTEGVDATRVAKKPPTRGYASPPPWTVLPGNDSVTEFVQLGWDTGFVLGGTAWDFANAGKVPRRGLDLLVIDEAGQFSLANTIAVGVSARRMLLLGDPQQLPQVSQGLHPEPVDTSALGWLSDGHDVLPDELGYFLDESWRMHPALCAAVSDLAYENRLRSREPETTDRRLEGVEPGLHPIPVEHAGNSTESLEEAERVLDLVRAHIGLPWTDPASGRIATPLAPSDIIVVAPYNAQVELLRIALDAAGFAETTVGTVDKFQGQEAAVAIVSLTASSAADVPRGIGFLLLRNRLNVAISRAQWAAYLVHSPALRDYLPTSAVGLAELSTFIRLTATA